MLCLAQWIERRWPSTGTVPWIWAIPTAHTQVATAPTRKQAQARYGETQARRRKRHKEGRAKDGLKERSAQRRHASAPAYRTNVMKTTLLPRSVGQRQRGSRERQKVDTANDQLKNKRLPPPRSKSGMGEYPGAAQTKRNEDGMNGMDVHTRKHTQARYGGMAKEHEPAAANATRKGGPRMDNESKVHNATLLPLSIGHQRGSRSGNTTNRSVPASAKQLPPPRTSTPWYGTKGDESAHTRRQKCEHRCVIRRATENAAATNMVPT